MGLRHLQESRRCTSLGPIGHGHEKARVLVIGVRIEHRTWLSEDLTRTLSDVEKSQNPDPANGGSTDGCASNCRSKCRARNVLTSKATFTRKATRFSGIIAQSALLTQRSCRASKATRSFEFAFVWKTRFSGILFALFSMTTRFQQWNPFQIRVPWIRRPLNGIGSS
jgi:hypothetical protein